MEGSTGKSGSGIPVMVVGVGEKIGAYGNDVHTIEGEQCTGPT